MSASTTVVSTLVNAPLPQLIEKLGLSVASAQAALDRNSITLAQEMAITEVDIGGESYNLLSLGFAPTFYAFTDATVEARLEFSVKESTEWSLGAKIGIGTEVFGASVSASYARKFAMSAEGSSSIAARLVSLPPPDIFAKLLQQIADEDAGGGS